MDAVRRPGSARQTTETPLGCVILVVIGSDSEFNAGCGYMLTHVPGNDWNPWAACCSDGVVRKDQDMGAWGCRMAVEDVEHELHPANLNDESPMHHGPGTGVLVG